MIGRVVPVDLLTSYIRELLESDHLLSDVWIEGEVSEMFVSRNGHVYFTLRAGSSQIKCVLFRGNASRQASLPRLGEMLTAHGNVTVYEQHGTYQLVADVVQPAGIGLLALEFEKLRQKLEFEGLFEISRKRPLPPSPRFIGVVTSAEGAVWHDIQTVIRRRYPLTHLLLAACPVQGEAAPKGILNALESVFRDGRAEIVIVARGGGSPEDLACFNDERVARAVFASRIPVISAIGHETDWTMIDWVADVRAATPSAAAELCVPSIDALREHAEVLRRSASTGVMAALRSAQLALDHRVEAFEPDRFMRRLHVKRQELRLLQLAVDTNRRACVEPRLRQLRSLHTALSSRADATFQARKTTVSALHSSLAAMNPDRVLDRGYSVVTIPSSGSPILSADGAPAGTDLEIRLRDGSISAVAGRRVHPTSQREG